MNDCMAMMMGPMGAVMAGAMLLVLALSVLAVLALVKYLRRSPLEG